MEQVIWDVDPVELTITHLLEEWKNLHRLWEAVHRRRTGQMTNPSSGCRFGRVDHPETMRFRDRPELLVARWFWLRDAGHAREVRLTGELCAALSDGSVVRQDEHFFIGIPEEFGSDWYHFRLTVGWPTLDSQWWGPWEREGVSYEHYRLLGRTADGVLGVPQMLPPDEQFQGTYDADTQEAIEAALDVLRVDQEDGQDAA